MGRKVGSQVRRSLASEALHGIQLRFQVLDLPSPPQCIPRVRTKQRVSEGIEVLANCRFVIVETEKHLQARNKSPPKFW